MWSPRSAHEGIILLMHYSKMQIRMLSFILNPAVVIFLGTDRIKWQTLNIAISLQYVSWCLCVPLAHPE